MKIIQYKYIPTLPALFVGSLLMLASSCKKFIEVGPPKNLIDASTVYENDATATAVIRGIYSDMINGGGFASGGLSSVTFVAGLSADELIAYSSGYVPYYTNSLTPTNITPTLWSGPYKYINNANAVLEGLSQSSGVTAATKNQLMGEAKFIRAFCYFYLVNLFGDVPLVLSTDYRTNATLSRTAKADVYQQIIADLTDAQTLLAADYSFSKNERDQPNKWAATALLARVYLYTGQWAKAEAAATAVIGNTSFSLPTDLSAVFVKNSPEAIWQLKPSGTSFNTSEGNLFILIAPPSTSSLSLSLYSAFENGDNRKTKWIGTFTSGTTVYYYPYKYKVQTGTALNEYSMVLRLAEQYLIRAEARAQQNINLTGAQNDLNVIRNRAGLGNTTAATKEELIAAILKERRVELFTEWGHRWLDLKRTQTVDSVMTLATAQKGGTWKSYQQLYPIPQSEILADKNIIQNDQY